MIKAFQSNVKRVKKPTATEKNVVEKLDEILKLLKEKQK